MIVMEPAVLAAYLGGGVIFIIGLLSGVWKYWHIHGSANATAPIYVDITHRAALLYAFASMLIAEFAQLSVWPNWLDLVAVLMLLSFFVGAIGTYALHGLLRDTDNQFAKPHKVGAAELPAWLMTSSMIALIIGEVGGFLILFAGFLKGL